MSKNKKRAKQKSRTKKEQKQKDQKRKEKKGKKIAKNLAREDTRLPFLLKELL